MRLKTNPKDIPLNTRKVLKDPWAFIQAEVKARPHWTTRYIAEQTGISRSGLRQLFNGRASHPKYPVLQLLVTFVLDHYNEKGPKKPKFDMSYDFRGTKNKAA